LIGLRKRSATSQETLSAIENASKMSGTEFEVELPGEVRIIAKAIRAIVN